MNFPRSPHALDSFFGSPRAAALCALLLRLAVLGISQSYIDLKHHHYHSIGFEAMVLAYALVHGHGYSFPFPNFVATGWLAPVYVWILALGTFLLGKNGALVIIFGQTWNILFSALTCYPIFMLGKTVAGRTTGIIAAWTWAFLPVAILMPIAFTWDQSLAALLMAVLFVLSYTLAESSSPWLWSAYGLLWGVAALANPSLFILFPCFAVWFWLRRRESMSPVGKPLALATLTCVLVLVPWTVRNWLQLGGFTFVKSNFGVELWLGNNPEVKTVWTPMHNPLNDEKELSQMVSMGELKYNHAKEIAALAFIESHPATFARLSLNRVIDTWTACYDSREDVYIQPLGIRPFYIFFSTLFTLAAVAGLLAVLAKDWLQRLPLACAVVVFPFPYYLTHSSQRYRHPIDPILTVLAVVGVTRIWGRCRARVPATGAHDPVSTDLKTSFPLPVLPERPAGQACKREEDPAQLEAAEK